MIRGPGQEWAGTRSSEPGRIVGNFPVPWLASGPHAMNVESCFHSHSPWSLGLRPRCMIGSVFIRKGWDAAILLAHSGPQAVAGGAPQSSREFVPAWDRSRPGSPFFVHRCRNTHHAALRVVW